MSRSDLVARAEDVVMDLDQVRMGCTAGLLDHRQEQNQRDSLGSAIDLYLEYHENLYFHFHHHR